MTPGSFISRQWSLRLGRAEARTSSALQLVEQDLVALQADQKDFGKKVDTF